MDEGECTRACAQVMMLTQATSLYQPGREERGSEPKMNRKKGCSVFPLRPIQQRHRDKGKRQDGGMEGWGVGAGDRRETKTKKKPSSSGWNATPNDEVVLSSLRT